MRELITVARGIGALTLTGLGLLVVLRGDGAGTHIVLGSVLIAGGVALAAFGTLFAVIDGGFEDDPPRAPR